jgi:hypothetical protein
MDDRLRTRFYIAVAGVAGWWGYLFIKYMDEPSSPRPDHLRSKPVWDMNDYAEALRWAKVSWEKAHAHPTRVYKLLLEFQDHVNTLPNSVKKNELLVQLKDLIDEMNNVIG